MSTAELKKELLAKINGLEDRDLLNEIMFLINSFSEDFVYELNEAQTTAIQEGRAQIENGDFLTGEEVEKEFEKWSKK